MRVDGLDPFQHFIIQAASIEQAALYLAFEQGLMGVLSMDVHQVFAKIAQKLYGYGAAIGGSGRHGLSHDAA